MGVPICTAHQSRRKAVTLSCLSSLRAPTGRDTRPRILKRTPVVLEIADLLTQCKTTHPSDMRYGRISSSTVSTFSSVSVSNASLSSSSPMSAMPGVAKGDSMSVDDMCATVLPLDADPLREVGCVWEPRCCSTREGDDDFAQHVRHGESAAGLEGTKYGGTKAPAGDAWNTVAAATHPPTKHAPLTVLILGVVLLDAEWQGRDQVEKCAVTNRTRLPSIEQGSELIGHWNQLGAAPSLSV